jgi:hypothetical protein
MVDLGAWDTSLKVGDTVYDYEEHQASGSRPAHTVFLHQRTSLTLSVSGTRLRLKLTKFLPAE